MTVRVAVPASLLRDYLRPLGYRRRQVIVVPTTSVTLQELSWFGGTRYTYTVFEIGHYEPLRDTSRYSMLHPLRNHAEGASVPMPEGHIVVQHGHFCGKVALARVYVHPSNMPALLPPQAASG